MRLQDKKILNGEQELNYRQIQQLVKINKLGKATGTKKLLEKRLLTYFQRLDQVKQMTRWEALNIRYNLDGDEEGGPTEDERAQYGAARDKEYVELYDDKEFGNRVVEKDRCQFQRNALKGFVADLDYYDAKQGAEKRRALEVRRQREVMGAFYAAPAKTGRARCQICNQKIAKDTIRVTHHDLAKFYNSSGGWTPRHSEKHQHATCFVKSDDRSSKANPVEVTLDDASKEFLTNWKMR